MQPSLTKRSDNLSRGNTKNDKDHPYIRAFECTFNYETSVYYQWPGVEAYFRYLEESCFEPLLADDYTALWPVICLPRPSSPAECWPWFSAVCSAVRTGGDKKSSIDDIWGLICNPGDNASNHASLRPAGQEKFAPLIAIFAVLCWSTMTLTPQLCWADFQSGPSLMVAQHQQQRPTQSRRASDQLQSLKMDIVRRPVPAVFRNFQRTMRTSRWRRPIGSGSRDGDISPVLHVSTLNYESLKTIGKIRLKWVNDLSSHLDFNAQDRSLSLFRFPTFCALNTLRESRGPVFDESAPPAPVVGCNMIRAANTPLGLRKPSTAPTQKALMSRSAASNKSAKKFSCPTGSSSASVALRANSRRPSSAPPKRSIANSTTYSSTRSVRALPPPSPPARSAGSPHCGPSRAAALPMRCKMKARTARATISPCWVRA